MADVLTPEQRSFNMGRIRGKDTKPEMVIRRLVHSMGHRYRLHRRDLPGTPDLVFCSSKRIINVHGCYWHKHTCRFGRVAPVTNAEFWEKKRAGTVERDVRNDALLKERGWTVMTIWECEVNSPEIKKLIRRFLK
jgi:DNA mismatch endonuclease (patch repair protein)